MHNPRVDENGNLYWLNDQRVFHREDGPAFIFLTGEEIWFLHGERHRADGPAVEYSSGMLGFYLHGVEYADLGKFCNDAGITGMQRTFFLLKYTGRKLSADYS